MALSLESEHPIKAYGYAARDTSGTLSPLTFSRRATGDKDVRFKVLYCGICHSDLHFAKNEWGMSTYPLVPGHRLCGVTEVGGPKFQIIQRLGTKWGLDVWWDHADHVKAALMISKTTKAFCASLARKLPLASGAPLLVTLRSSWLRLLVLKLLFSVPPLLKSKKTLEDSKLTNSREQGSQSKMQSAASSLDGIIDTVSATHPIAPLLSVLKPHGKLVLVGQPEKPLEIAAYSLIMGRKIVAGSAIGGQKETQEMLDFAAKHGITADIELIPIDYVNTALERILKSDVNTFSSLMLQIPQCLHKFGHWCKLLWYCC
ncbi:8-hydroxygeraniol dehydrogenase-like protein [Tanacetum coccineum]